MLFLNRDRQMAVLLSVFSHLMEQCQLRWEELSTYHKCVHEKPDEIIYYLAYHIEIYYNTSNCNQAERCIEKLAVNLY